MRILLTKFVEKFARQEDIADASLIEAVRNAEQGLIAADLGGGLIKQRVARQGQGKSGGYRMILAFQVQGRTVFLYAFAKNEKDNISPKQLKAFKAAAEQFQAMSDKTIAELIEAEKIFEIEV